MIFSSRLALGFLVLFCTHSLFALELTNNPWASIQTAEAFMSNFMDDAVQSGAFSDGQINDMSTIRETVMAAMEKMSRGTRISKSKLQALNLAFASTVAEIVVVEEGGQSIEVKIEAIIDALRSAFLKTTGAVNVQFVNEIKSLIFMFLKNNTNPVSNGDSSVRGGNEEGVASASTTEEIGKSKPTFSDSGPRYGILEYSSTGSQEPSEPGLQRFADPGKIESASPQVLSEPTQQQPSGTLGVSYAPLESSSYSSISVSSFGSTSQANTGEEFHTPSEENEEGGLGEGFGLIQGASDQVSYYSEQGGLVGGIVADETGNGSRGGVAPGEVSYGSTQGGQSRAGQDSYYSVEVNSDELGQKGFEEAAVSATNGGGSEHGGFDGGYESGLGLQGGTVQEEVAAVETVDGSVKALSGGYGQVGYGSAQLGQGRLGEQGAEQQSVNGGYGYGAGQGGYTFGQVGLGQVGPSGTATGLSSTGVAEQRGFGAAYGTGEQRADQVAYGYRQTNYGGLVQGIDGAATGSAGQGSLGGGGSQDDSGLGQVVLGGGADFTTVTAGVVADGPGEECIQRDCVSGQGDQGGLGEDGYSGTATAEFTAGGAEKNGLTGEAGQVSYGSGVGGPGEEVWQSGLGAVAAADGQGSFGEGSGQGSFGEGSGQGSFGEGSGQGRNGQGIYGAGQGGYNFGQGDQSGLEQGLDRAAVSGVGPSSIVGGAVEVNYGSEQASIGLGEYGQGDYTSGQRVFGVGAVSATAVTGESGQGGLSGGFGPGVYGSQLGDQGELGLGGAAASATTAYGVGQGALGGGKYEPGQGGYGLAQRVASDSTGVFGNDFPIRFTGEAPQPGTLSHTIGKAISQIDFDRLERFGCEALFRALFQIATELVHILSFVNIGQVNSSGAGASTQLVSQLVSQVMR